MMEMRCYTLGTECSCDKGTSIEIIHMFISISKAAIKPGTAAEFGEIEKDKNT